MKYPHRNKNKSFGITIDGKEHFYIFKPGSDIRLFKSEGSKVDIIKKGLMLEMGPCDYLYHRYFPEYSDKIAKIELLNCKGLDIHDNLKKILKKIKRTLEIEIYTEEEFDACVYFEDVAFLYAQVITRLAEHKDILHKLMGVISLDMDRVTKFYLNVEEK